MADPTNTRRMERLQQIRRDMETLHATALAERHGKTFTTGETLRLIQADASIDEIDATRSMERPS
ncbi:hypothetical protein [Microbacterium sp.]|uniref:hypothetical protein n=1 Tax=Microbacterium sp. TaxID=51671 RepID=UPI003D6F80D9